MEQEEILHATAKELEITIAPGSAVSKQALIDRINELLLTDFSRLVGILYRIDVNETRLRSLLDQQADRDAAVIIADLVLERQLQKLKSRQQFSGQDENIDENEKW
jgi:hypothetical protein